MSREPTASYKDSNPGQEARAFVSVKLSHCPQFLPTRPKQLSLQLPEGPCGFLITSPVQSQLG